MHATTIFCTTFTFFQLIAPIGHAEETEFSSITFPISIDLGYVAARANADIPQRLADIRENNMVCIEGKQAKYEYPCVYDWYKTKMCKGWTWAPPPLKCDVSGYVDRRGPLTLSGSGETLSMSLPIHASISAKALVSETAKADATFFVDAVLSINEDWEPTLEVESDFHWDKRPTLKLFNFIKITIGSRVEPKLREEMAKIQAKIPSLLQDLNVRGEVERIWDQVQRPIQISADPSVYVVFIPTSVGFSGLNSQENKLTATVKIDGHTSVTLGESPNVNSVALLPLQKIEHQDAKFSIVIPTVVEEDELQAALSKELSDGFSLVINEGELSGEFTAKNLLVSLSEAAGIKISAEITYDNRSKFLRFIDIFDWFDFSGSVSLAAKPNLDLDSNTIGVEDLRLSASTSSGLADTLVDVLDLPLVRDEIAKLIVYSYEKDVQDAILTANEAINIELEKGVRIAGSLDGASANDLLVQDKKMSILVRAIGSVEAKIE